VWKACCGEVTNASASTKEEMGMAAKTREVLIFMVVVVVVCCCQVVRQSGR
jgi:hypothetical protein